MSRVAQSVGGQVELYYRQIFRHLPNNHRVLIELSPPPEAVIKARHLNIFIAKRVNSIFVNLRFKLLKYKENNKNICNTYDPKYYKFSYLYYAMVHAHTLKMSKMAFNSFCDKTL